MSDVPGVLGGAADGVDPDKWMEACRTKFIGLDGKPLPPPRGGYGALSQELGC